jgi:hypothetical protein
MGTSARAGAPKAIRDAAEYVQGRALRFVRAAPQKQFAGVLLLCCVVLTFAATLRLRYVPAGSNVPAVYDTWTGRFCLPNGCRP